MFACFPDRSIDLPRMSRRLGMTPVIPLLLAVFLLVHNVVAENPSEVQDRARLGISLAREGKLPEAEQELRQAVQSAPGVALHRAQLASILGLQGKWQEALGSFQKAIDLDPTNLNFRRETAAVQWQLHLMSAAEKNLQYVLAINPGDPGAILLLGLVSEAKGDYLTAARLLDSQFELVITQPDRTVALFHSLFQSNHRGDVPKVVDALRLRANDPAWAGALSRCTQIAAVAGDLETSESLFLLISAEEPSRAAAAFQLAKLRYSVGHLLQAQQLLSQLAASDSGNADIQALLGHCYESLHQPDAALRAYQRAMEFAPSQVDRYEDLIILQLELGRTSDAMALANRVTSVAPGNARSWVLKGNVELSLNAFQDALNSYTRASSLDRFNPNALLGLAAIHSLSGLSETAIADYKVGIQRFPNDARFFVAFAATLLNSPEAPQAYPQVKSLLQQAVKLDPHSPDAHYQLGQLALRRGQLGDAKAEFLASLQADPNRSNTHFALSLAYRRLGQSDDAAKHFAIYSKLKKAEEGEARMSDQAAGKP